MRRTPRCHNRPHPRPRPPPPRQGFKALSQQGQHDALVVARQQRTVARLSARLLDARRRAALSGAEAEAGNDALATACSGADVGLSALAATLRGSRSSALGSLEGAAGAAREAGRALRARLALAQRILGLAEQVRAGGS